jgi:hypothetical protein
MEYEILKALNALNYSSISYLDTEIFHVIYAIEPELYNNFIADRSPS